MNIIEEIMKATHKTVENRPEPYGLFHLVFVFSSLVIMVLLCFLMRKSKEKTFRIVMFSIGFALILSEVYKQLYYYYAAGVQGYDWNMFPFQLCSVPMYVALAVGLLKKSKVRDAMCEYLVSIGFLGGIMAYLEPSGILNPYYFTLIHSCLWHALLIFIALFILFTNNACGKIKDYRKALLILGLVIFTATALNIIFQAKPNFNMCYISPFNKTPLAVFSSFDTFFMGIIGDLLGRIISITIYLVALCLGGFLIYLACYKIKRKLIEA